MRAAYFDYVGAQGEAVSRAADLRLPRPASRRSCALPPPHHHHYLLSLETDTFIQNAKKQYKDVRAQRNLNKLNDELNDVTRIMNRNIQDVLGRGETLDRR